MANQGVYLVLTAPELKGGSTSNVRTFLEEWAIYKKKFEARKADGSLNQNAQIEKMINSVEPKLFKRIWKYEMAVADEAAATEALFEAHLRRKLSDFKTALSLEDALKPLRVEASEKEPAEKVGKLFQQVEDLLDKHNLSNVFKPKKVNKLILQSLYPEEIKARALRWAETSDGMTKLKDRMELYKYLVQLYVEWYDVHPTGYARPPKEKKPQAYADSSEGGRKNDKTRAKGKGKNGDKKRGRFDKTARPQRACWECGDEGHLLHDCPHASAEKKADAAKQQKQRQVTWAKAHDGGTAAGAKPKSAQMTRELTEGAEDSNSCTTVTVLVNGQYEAKVGPDTQASRTIIHSGTLAAMRKVTLVAEKTIEPMMFQLGDNRQVECTGVVVIDLALQTKFAPVTLRGVEAYVLEGEAGPLLLGNTELDRLGYQSPADWLDELASKGPVELPPASPQELRPLEQENKAKRVVLVTAESDSDTTTTNGDNDHQHAGDSDDEELEMPEEGLCRPSAGLGDVVDHKLRGELASGLEDMLRRAERHRPSASCMKRLRALVDENEDVFRLELGQDRPANVPCMVIRIADEPLLNWRPRVRKFAPLQREFIDAHVELLLSLGVIRPSRSRYASPITLVRKSDSSWRMCVDLRRMNSATMPEWWPLPKVISLLPHLAGAKFFSSFDLLRGYWQFPLSEDSCKYMAFLTHKGVYEFTRVVMGARNSASHFQRVMTEIFDDLLNNGVIVYLDDILVYAKTEVELLGLIIEVFKRLLKAGIKLKPKKAELFSRSLLWCGYTIDEHGHSINPATVEAAQSMVAPTDAGQLQQFLASCNWVRGFLPAYAELVGPLQNLLLKAMTGLKRRTTAAASKVSLADHGWGKEHDASFAALKAALVTAVTSAYPDDEKEFCLFTDASDDYWGAILTQVPAGSTASDVPICDWNHEPLAFLSGVFRGPQKRWGVPDKEGFAIKESCLKLAHLLVRRKGVSIFTDHRNLRYIFNPLAVVAQVTKPQADRLERWAVFLRCFDYKIYHIPGELNVWGDMLSRWAPGTVEHLADRERRRAAAKTEQPAVMTQTGAVMQAAAVTEIRVRDDRVLASAAHEATRIAQGTGAPEEQWPTLQEIVAAQQQVSEIKRQTLALCLSKDVLLTEEGKIYIPDGEHGLRHRVLVIAHAGAAGHRRQKATTELLKSVCWWEEMADDLAAFLSNCLLCMKTATNQTAPRPYGQTLNGQQPGEALHMDYCSMLKLGETSNCRFKGILVAKDGLSGFLLLNNVEKYDAETTEACAIQWASIFGVPLYFISDGGSHFNNKIVIALMKRFKTLHHIVTAYAPWANGTIERVMREIVKLYRLLLAESNLPIENWHLLTPLVQATLNQAACATRANFAPAKLQLARNTIRPLDTIAWSALTEEQGAAVQDLQLSEKCRQYFKATARAVQADWLHAAAGLRRRHDQNVVAREKVIANSKRKADQFQIGEYVLVLNTIPTNKLRTKWMGPYQITTTINTNVYVVKDLLRGYEKTVHAQRMKLYADASLLLTEDIKNSAAYDASSFVDSIVGHRETDTGTIEFEVQWSGFESNENTWEPIKQLHEDVPFVVEQYLTSVGADFPLGQLYLTKLIAARKSRASSKKKQ